MKKSKLLITLVSAFLMSACIQDAEENLQDSIVETTPETNDEINPSALFDPSSGVIPFPNNLLLAGSTDGTLNIPVADPNNFADPQVALNAIDGFSTVAPMSAGFSTGIDASSVGAAVKIYEVTLSGIGGVVTSVDDELTFGTDFVASASGSTLAILPLRPLDPASSYSVVITDSLMTSGGNAFGPSVTYRLFQTLTEELVCPIPVPADLSGCNLPGAFFPDSNPANLTQALIDQFEGLRRSIVDTEQQIAAFDGTRNIIVSWNFTTQSVGQVLTTVRGLAGSPTTSLAASTVDLGLGAGPGRSYAGAANVFEGTIEVPYYLTAPASASPTDQAVILSNPWQADNAVGGENNLTALNPLPATDGSVTIPLLVTTPFDTATYPAPWQTVIFQHGITRDRTDMLAAADSLAAAGFAVVAIDMPLHGVGSTNDFYQSGNERTFDVDLVTQDGSGNITAAVPDMNTDSSGRHFINIPNLLVTRDNLRQSVADLFALTAAIPTMDIGDGGAADFDGSNIYFVGHSMGAIVGTTFTALESNVKDAVFGMGGGSLPKTFDGSAALSPSLVGGLAANGVDKGTADYESFLGAAQTVVDTTDPINHAEDAASGRGVLYFEIVGGANNMPPSDLVVPNTVPDANDSGNTVPAPLAGTEPVLTLMGLTQVNSDQAGADLQHSVKFVAGNHSSLLNPAADAFNDAPTNAAVTTEMQSIMATFLGSDGAVINVDEASAATLLQAPPP